MTFKHTFPILLAACALSATAHADTVLFDFENQAPGTSTSFTDTLGGLSATFASNADPGGFVVFTPGLFVTLTGNVLGDPGPAGQDMLALDISFSGELNSINLNFATADFISPSSFTLTAYQNSTLVGSNTAAGLFAGSLFPEGVAAFNGANFNHVVLSSPAMDFAVDNIQVTTATVPEPSPLSLFAISFALLGLGSWRRRSRRRAASSR